MIKKSLRTLYMDLYSTNNNILRASIGSAARGIDYAYFVGSVIIGCSFMKREIIIINPQNSQHIHTYPLKERDGVIHSNKIFTIDNEKNTLYFQEISQNQSSFDTFDCATGKKTMPTQLFKTDIPILYLWNNLLSSIHIRGNKIYIYSTETNCLYRTYILNNVPQYGSNYLFIDNHLYFLASHVSTQMSCMYSLSINEIRRTAYFSIDINDADYKYTTISYVGDKIILCCPNVKHTDITYIQLSLEEFIFTNVPNTSIINNQFNQPITSLQQVPEIKYKLNIISNDQFSSLSSIIGKNGKNILPTSNGINLLNPEISNQFLGSICCCIVKSMDKCKFDSKIIPKENTGAVFVKSDIYIDYLNWIIDNYNTSEYTTVYFYNQYIYKCRFIVNGDRSVLLDLNLHTISATYDNFFMSMGKVNMTDMTIMIRHLCLPMGKISPFCQNNNMDYMVPFRDNFNRVLRDKIIHLFISLNIPYVSDFSWSPHMYYKISLSLIRRKPLEFWKRLVQLLNIPTNMDLYSILPYFWTHLFL
jgi:hypothetical protein